MPSCSRWESLTGAEGKVYFLCKQLLRWTAASKFNGATQLLQPGKQLFVTSRALVWRNQSRLAACLRPMILRPSLSFAYVSKYFANSLNIRQFCERCCKFKLVDVANGMQGTFRNIPAIHSIVAVSSGTISAFLITAFLSAM